MPELFLDRSLGRIQVPMLLRGAGLQLRTLAEVYGMPADEAVSDVEWLTRAGREGWPVLMKDERIRYRPAERAVVLASGVTGFCLVNGNLKAAAMAELIIGAADEIAVACRQPGPSLYAVSKGHLRKIEL